MPYYFNLFALVVNKETIFMGKQGKLIEYSFPFEETRRFNKNFTRE